MQLRSEVRLGYLVLDGKLEAEKVKKNKTDRFKKKKKSKTAKSKIYRLAKKKENLKNHNKTKNPAYISVS